MQYVVSILFLCATVCFVLWAIQQRKRKKSIVYAVIGAGLCFVLSMTSLGMNKAPENLTTTGDIGSSSSDSVDSSDVSSVEVSSIDEEVSSESVSSREEISSTSSNTSTERKNTVSRKKPVSSKAPAKPSEPTKNPPVKEPSPSEKTPVVEDNNPSKSNMVWITEKGKKYHSSPDCSNMKNPHKISLEDAIASGREPCKKCY